MSDRDVIEADDVRSVVRAERRGRRRGRRPTPAAAGGHAPATLREFKEWSERAFLVEKLREFELEHLEDRRRHRHAAQQSLQEARAIRHQAGNRRVSRGSTLGTDSREFGVPPQSEPDDRRRRRSFAAAAKTLAAREGGGRKVRTPQGSAPGNSRSGQLEGQWHRKYTASPSRRKRARRGKGEKVR